MWRETEVELSGVVRLERWLPASDDLPCGRRWEEPAAVICLLYGLNAGRWAGSCHCSTQAALIRQRAAWCLSGRHTRSPSGLTARQKISDAQSWKSTHTHWRMVWEKMEVRVREDTEHPTATPKLIKGARHIFSLAALWGCTLSYVLTSTCQHIDVHAYCVQCGPGVTAGGAQRA